jgi:hypothetical protein
MKRRSWLFTLVLGVLVPSAALASEPVVVSVDTVPRAQLLQMIHGGYQEEIDWADAYGDFVDVHAYVPYVPGVTVDQAWEYIQDIRNLEDWTMSVRNLQPMGTLDGRTRYVAEERLPPGGNIYFLEEKDPVSRTVDWWVGHDPEDIWMRYYMRVLDAEEVIGKPGVVITWVNFGHENFKRNPDLQQGFLMMKIAHGLERDNLAQVLAYRAEGNTGPLSPDTMAQLGLVNVELYDPMMIWGMIASQVTPTVPWSEYYGDFIGSHFFLPGVGFDETFGYLEEPSNMEDWTVSLRNVRRCEGGLRVNDRLGFYGALDARWEVYPGSQTIDLFMRPVGHGRWGGGNLFNSTMRVLDGMETTGEEGSVVVWIGYRHEVMEENWALGQYWKYLPVRNRFGAQNVGVLLGAM